MARVRKRRKRVDVIAVRAGRALGKSYAQIGAELGVDPSSVWYAINRQQARTRVDPPAGKQRSVWVSDERWEHVRDLADRHGTSMSMVVAKLIDDHMEWLRTNDPLPLELEPAIAGADA